MDGRPPVNVGVTSGGDIFGGTAVTFSDVLGDQQFSLYAASISQYRTLSLSYLNLAHRFNYAIQGYSQTQFFYGNLENVFYDPSFSGLHRSRPVDRHADGARRNGVRHLAVQPVSPRRGVRGHAAVQRVVQRSDPAGLLRRSTSRTSSAGRCSAPAPIIPLGVNFVQETTVFREFGPLAGNTMRASYEVAPKIGNTLSRQTTDIDARYYQRLGATGLLALRAQDVQKLG